MQGRRSQHPDLLSIDDNIHMINKRKQLEASDSESESSFSKNSASDLLDKDKMDEN